MPRVLVTGTAGSMLSCRGTLRPLCVRSGWRGRSLESEWEIET